MILSHGTIRRQHRREQVNERRDAFAERLETSYQRARIAYSAVDSLSFEAERALAVWASLDAVVALLDSVAESLDLIEADAKGEGLLGTVRGRILDLRSLVESARGRVEARMTARREFLATEAAGAAEAKGGTR